MKRMINEELIDYVGELSEKIAVNDDGATIKGKAKAETLEGDLNTDQIHNTKGNAMVRYKSTETGTPIVFGSSAKPALIMGSGERPNYSSDGADFDGKPMALKSDLDNIDFSLYALAIGGASAVVNPVSSTETEPETGTWYINYLSALMRRYTSAYKELIKFPLAVSTFMQTLTDVGTWQVRENVTQENVNLLTNNSYVNFNDEIFIVLSITRRSTYGAFNSIQLETIKTSDGSFREFYTYNDITRITTSRDTSNIQVLKMETDI